MVKGVQRVWTLVVSGWRWVAGNPREWMLAIGLGLLHVGFRGVEPWAPGASLMVPGAILTAIAVFGARGSAAVRRRKE